jgi:hypothetical protein
VATGEIVPNHLTHIDRNLNTTYKHFNSLGDKIQKESMKRLWRAAMPASMLLDELAELEEFPGLLLLSSASNLLAQNDNWSMPNMTALGRTHVNPRIELFVPTSENCPVPLQWVDTFRQTESSLDHGTLREINDFWSVDARAKPRDRDEQ